MRERFIMCVKEGFQQLGYKNESSWVKRGSEQGPGLKLRKGNSRPVEY